MYVSPPRSTLMATQKGTNMRGPLLLIAVALSSACTSDLTTKTNKLSTQTTDLESRLAAAETNITALQTALTQAQTNIASLQSGAASAQTQANATDQNLAALTDYTHSRHDELLFAWDGSGRYLGRLFTWVQTTATSPLWASYFVHPSTGLIVAYTNIPTINTLYFASTDCTGDAVFSWTAQPITNATDPVAFLDQGTGNVYAWKSWQAPYVATHSQRDIAGGACSLINSGPTDHDLWQIVYTISSFTAGVTIGPSTWPLP